ncbi:hypothetical protein ACWYEE_005208 [Klebsiella variicola]
MTKSTITRERLEELASGQSGFNLRIATLEESQQLASMALAAMDSSESIELPLDYLQGHKDGLEWAAQLAEANHPETGDWLYDDPIELAKAIRKGPDMPPAQPAADSEPVAWTWQHLKQWHVTNDEERARDLAWDGVKVEPLYRHAQPAPVVVPNGLRLALSNAGIAAPESDEMLAATCEKHIQALVTWVKDRKPFQSAPVVPDAYVRDESGRMMLNGVCEPKIGFGTGWNACRAAMLQASNSPAQSDCCPAQNHVSPEQNSVSPAQSPIDHGYRPECECSGCKATARICAELSANSTANPDCWCRTCRPVTLNDMRFVVCPDCGNKRCPRANDHRNACTRSNEPGQEGSAYPAAPQEVKGE